MSRLLHGAQTEIARKLRVSTTTVHNVVHGRVRSRRVEAALRKRGWGPPTLEARISRFAGKLPPGTQSAVARHLAVSKQVVSQVVNGLIHHEGIETALDAALSVPDPAVAAPALKPYSPPLPAVPIALPTGEVICPGTQDYIDPITKIQYGLPDDFDQIVSDRSGRSLLWIERVSSNRTVRLPRGEHYGEWDWIVCREARYLCKEVEHAVAFISEKKAVRKTGLKPEQLRAKTSWKVEEGETFYDRWPLKLKLGKYPTKRSKRVKLHKRLLRIGEATIHKPEVKQAVSNVC